MKLFILGLFILLGGYFFYGKLIEKIVGPDDRETPAKRLHDGVDFIVLPHWKNMLIQLLNIAGVGPVIGVILGIKFGVIAFLIIPIGNIIGGAVHDFVAGMMSLRHNGANLPALIKMTTGKTFYYIFSIFMCFLLLLVVAVFINIPANLIDGFFKDNPIFWLAVALIFLYYVIATLFPVDKIIGAVYPIFGALLILGSLAIFVMLMIQGVANPELLDESALFAARKWTEANNHPVLPLLFVTIACGILSGFHATQSPIIARTMKHEREARASFYGMMVLEGIIGMIWAASALFIYNKFPQMFSMAPTKVLSEITGYFLGSWIGGLTIISVIILAVTSGDTAMRSLRLSLAEIFHVDQKAFVKRIVLCLPIIVIVAGLLWWSNKSPATFNQLWNYFAWGNQVLASCTLTAATVWLVSQKKPGWITALPGAFMTFIVCSYILWISPAHGGPLGFGMKLEHAQLLSVFIAGMVTLWAFEHGKASCGKFDQ